MHLHSTRIGVFTNLPEMKAKLASPKQTLVSMPVDRAGNGAEAAGRDSKVWKYVPDRQTEPSTCGTCRTAFFRILQILQIEPSLYFFCKILF